MKKSHNQMIIDTLTQGWMCYGQMLSQNNYASSLPRSVAKLREMLDTSRRETSVGLIGILNYNGKQYLWFETMRGKVKYFYLKEFIENSQPSLLDNVVQAPFGDSYKNAG